MKPAVSRLVTPIVTSPARSDLMRRLRALQRGFLRKTPTVHYFHQADDPYSHLVVQLLTPLKARYGVAIRPWLVSSPDDSAAPERERLNTYGLRDAPRVAKEYGLEFPIDAVRPSPAALEAAQSALAAAMIGSDFAVLAKAIGDSLWSGRTAKSGPPIGTATVDGALKEGKAERRRLGHYLGAMLYFEGEWYWGVDRLNHLEERLRDMGLDSTPNAPALAAYRDMCLAPPPPGSPVEIEIWFSFRSPYSWIAFPRVRRLARHYGARLRLRYILPMVMRGLPVPPVKTMYITLDTKREADRVGLPYGTIVDPVGPGAERCLAVLHHAVGLGRGEDFSELGMKAAFADGIDLASDAGLFGVARAAGLTDDQTRAALADESWREAAEDNRQALFDAGLWGAPTYRVNGGPAHWGQDRLWALEQDIRRAMGG